MSRICFGCGAKLQYSNKDSKGYVPENKCFENGLIPLRDGSITGLEYSTVVLEGKQGINTLNYLKKNIDKYYF